VVDLPPGGARRSARPAHRHPLRPPRRPAAPDLARLAPDAREVCVKPPGFDEDLVVTASEEWLAKWHMGKISLGTAMHEGLIDVKGPRALVRTFATLGLSRFASI
jgi:hypothetical protein